MPRSTEVPRCVAITDGALDLGRVRGVAFQSWLRDLHRHGVALQIREKHLGDGELYSIARTIREGFAGCLLVNGRLDIAFAAGADGVHLTSTSAPPERVRDWAADHRLLIGVSTHSLSEIRDAEKSRLDYVVFGPVFPTPSKARFGAPQGLEQLEEATRVSELPVLAVGGIDPGNAAEALAAGAHGVAAIRGFADPQALATRTQEG
ncbi:MAG: thiamine phosphate synthase [Acidobacteriota bacterium]